MLRIVGSTLSLVVSGQCSIVPATNGSQHVGGCNLLLIWSPSVTCSPKTEPKVTVMCCLKTERKGAKNFKRMKSIPIQTCFSKNDNIQIQQYNKMSQDLNPITCSPLVIFMYWACENHTFNATPAEKLQQLRFCNESHLLHVLFVKVVPGTTFTSWSKHHFVVIGKAEKQVRKASHCRTKQQ